MTTKDRRELLVKAEEQLKLAEDHLQKATKALSFAIAVVASVRDMTRERKGKGEI